MPILSAGQYFPRSEIREITREDIVASGDYSQLDLAVDLTDAAFIQFYFYAPVAMPYESFDLRVDGEFLTGLSTEDETWRQGGAILSSGPHTISWRLMKNPSGAPEELLASMPPPDYRLGEVWLDNVSLLTSTPSFVENWDTGDFSANPWALSGDVQWRITDSEQYNGTYSATVGQEDFEINSGVSQLSIDIITERGGALKFHVIPSVSGPFDMASVKMDDIPVLTFSTPENDWSEQIINIQPGKRKVTFEYFKNDGNLDAEILGSIPPPPGWDGQIWLDGIEFIANDEASF